MPNKPGHKILLAVLLFASGVAVDCHSQETNVGVAIATNSPTIDSLMQQYQPLAAYFLDKTIWEANNGKGLNESEQLQFQKLIKLTEEIVNSPEYQERAYKLLEGVQDHDGYTRQAIFSALLDRSYVRSDYPFLKQVFILSLKCKEADYPNLLRGWKKPGYVRFAVAIRISILTNPSKINPALDAADMRLLDTDPKAWINAQHP